MMQVRKNERKNLSTTEKNQSEQKGKWVTHTTQPRVAGQIFLIHTMSEEQYMLLFNFLMNDMKIMTSY